MKRVAFVVNGEFASAMGQRARAFAQRLPDRFDIRTMYRTGGKLSAIGRLVGEMRAFRPHTIYVFDMSLSGVLAATVVHLVRRTPVLIDTGDAIYELAKAIGRGRAGRFATLALEWHSLKLARRMVVRGRGHVDLLAARGIPSDWLPDGVETDLFTPDGDGQLPGIPGRDRPLVVGVLGSTIWNPRTRSCYGLELLEMLRLLPGLPVRGLIVGGGSGLVRLRELAEEWGIADRVDTVGPKPYLELPQWIRRMDIALSTQTDDIPGSVRTTGKLPLYLSCGRYIMASRVGEAARILPAEMLVDFHGVSDPDYAGRLAARVRSIVERPQSLSRGADSRSLAETWFDYSRLARTLAGILDAH